ncbi:CitB Response regulator containing a CheY-like receiver domain and an HTH DNA-binding domain [Candidatus Nanopelagicaceae bacterium]
MAPDVRSAIAIIRTQQFDCIVIDRELEDGDGLVLAPTIKRIQPDAISILLTSHTQWATREAAQQLGFHQVIDKRSTVDEIVSSIRILITPGNRIADRGAINVTKIHLLSLTEREILLNLATGATTEEIALMRHNSVATIKSHLSSIYRKLEVRNRVEAIAELRIS